MNRIILSQLLAVFAFFIFSFEVESQQIINENLIIPPRPKLQLRYSLLGHIEIKQPALQLGVEIKLHEHLGLNVEYGFIHDRFNIFNAPAGGFYNNHRTVRGSRIITELRYYLLKDWTRERLYISPRFETEKSIVNREDEIFRFEGEYSEMYQFVVHKRKNTFLLMLGFNIYEKNKLSINVYSGYGILHKVITNNLPPDAIYTQRRGISILDRPTDKIVPTTLMGFNLTWHLID